MSSGAFTGVRRCETLPDWMNFQLFIRVVKSKQCKERPSDAAMRSFSRRISQSDKAYCSSLNLYNPHHYCSDLWVMNSRYGPVDGEGLQITNVDIVNIWFYNLMTLG